MKKVVSVLLAVFFFTSTFNNVYAQGTNGQPNGNNGNGNNSGVGNGSGKPTPTPVYDDEYYQNLPDEPVSTEGGGETGGFEAQSFSLGGGSYEDVFSGSSFTNPKPKEPGLNSSGGYVSQHGAFLYSIPFELPRGVNGLTPDTSLVYNSQNTEGVSPYGYGWELDVPFIKRVNEEGLDYMYAGSGRDFYSSLSNGDLKKEASLSSPVAVEEGYYFAEVDDGSFLKYVFDDGYWKVTDKDGVTYYFGQDSDARIENRNYTSTSSTYSVYQWNLDKVVDAKGNEIIYEYTKTPNKYTKLDAIKYVKESDDSYLYTLAFDYDNTYRNYDAITYSPGFPVIQEDVLDDVRLFVDDSLAAIYDFNYSSSSLSGRVYLDSYQLSKISSAGATTTQPATSFEYSKTSAGFSLASGFDLLPIIDTQDLFNGSYNLPVVTYTREDGRQAIAGYYTEAGTTGTDFHYYYNPSTAQWVSDSSSGEGSEIFDTFFNDLDILADLDGNISTHENITIVNNSMPDDIEDIIDGYADDVIKNYVYAGDMNGDGWDDLYFFDDLGDNTEYSYFGGGATIQPNPWTYSTFWIPDDWEDDLGVTNWRYPWRSGMLDFNADGLDDLIDNERIRYNTGSSTVLKYTYSSLNEFDGLTYEEFGWRYHDVNGDGLVDILGSQNASSSTDVYFQKVDGTFYKVADYIPVDFARDYSGTVAGKGTWFFDINGDGYLDILHTDGEDDQDIYLNNADAVDLLYKVEEGGGKQLEVSYERTTELYDSSNNYENPDLPYSLNVVTSIEASDDQGATWYDYLSYNYEDASWYWSASYPQKFAGFGRVTETNHVRDRVTETYFHQGNDENSSYNEPADSRELIGKIYKQIVYDGSTSYKLSAGYYDWFADIQTTGLTRFTYVTQEYQSVFDSSGSNPRTTRSYYQADDFNGNAEFVTEWGEVNFNESNYSYTDVTGDRKSFTYTYADNLSALTEAQLLATDYHFAVSEVTLSDESANLMSNAEFYYDGNTTQGVLTDGLLTLSSEWHDESSSWYDTEFGHNTKGVINQIVDARGATTTLAIDTYNLYPTKETNALGHEIDFTYDYITGQQLSSVDENGTTEEFIYDGFGRPLTHKVTKPSGGTVTIASWSYDDNSFPRKITQAIYNTTSPQYKYEYFDGFGRLIQEKVSTSNSGEYNTVTYEYDGASRLTSETLPYTSATDSYQSSVPGTAEYVTTTFDPLDRVETVTNPNGNVNYTYSVWDTTITNENGDDKDYAYDAYGNLVEVTEYDSASDYVTMYTYDARDRLTSIIDELGNERDFAYDTLDRRISLELPHASGTTASAYAYEYDQSGNLTLETMPDGTEITYSYDLIGRMLTKDSDRDSGVEVSYTYDTSGNGIGRLASVQTSEYAKTFEYDQSGNVVEEVAHYPQGTFGQMYDPTPTGGGAGMGGPGPELALLEQELGLMNSESALSQESSDLSNEQIIPDEYAGVQSASSSVVQEEIDSLDDDNESAEETATSSVDLADDTTSTASTTVELIATTTIVEIASSSDKDTDISTTSSETASSTELGETQELGSSTSELSGVGSEKSQIKATGLVTSAKEAEVWRRYHRERVASLRENTEVGAEVVVQAEQAQAKYESFLLNEKFINNPTDEINILGYNVKKFFVDSVKAIARAILPDKAYAYLFDTEDFESCGSLPCSLDNNANWGSVTISLDSGGQINGDDSMKAVVTGEGGGAIETVNYNTGEIWTQFKVYIPSSFQWGTSGYFTVFRTEDSSNGSVVWMSVEDYGTPRLTVMGDVLGYTNTGIDLTEGAVNTIEVRIKTGSSNGDIDIWVDNTTEGSPDYNGSGTMNLGTDNVDDVLFGMNYVPETGLSTTYYDDLVVNDSFIGSLTASNASPTAPTSLEAEGQTNPTNITDPTPEFTAIYNDPDSGDSAVSYQIQVDDNSDFSSVYWNSGKTALATTTQGSRTGTVSYSGSALASSTTYYWRVKFWDDDDAEGVWSTSTATFSLAAGGGGGGTTTTAYHLYDDAINSSWNNWSWGVTIDESDTSPTAYADSYSMEVAYSASWKGVYLQNSSFDLSPYEDVELQVNVGTNTGNEIYIYLTNASGTAMAVKALSNYISGGYQSNTWQTATVPLSELNATNYSGAMGFVLEGSAAMTINYDEITFVGATTTSSSSNPVPGPEYATTTYSYTDYGLLDSVVYPSGVEVEYSYNVAGLPESVEVDNTAHVTNVVYDHRGVVTDIAYATNATTTFTYDVEKGYRLVAKETVKNGTTLEEIAYTYDNVGNILTIVDTGTIVPQSTTYTYDDLNRLKTADVTVGGTTYDDDYSYDAIGRITAHNSDSYTYSDGRHPHAPTAFGSDSYSYDVNGNLASSTVSGTSTSYSYDELDRLETITSGGTTTATYWYGDGRDRIAKSAGGYTTLYINPLTEYNRNGYNDAVMIDGARISTIDESATRWHIKDHLRSTAITIGDDDTLFEAIRYTPYGAERDRTGSYKSSHTYTDQVSDYESDLLYYNARYYDPSLRTFTSADPVAGYTPEQVLATPQLLNTFSYVANNPIVYNDPGGEYLDVAIDLGFTAYSVYRLGHAVLTGGDVRGEAINLALDAGGLLIPGVVGAGTAKRAGQAALKVENAGNAVTDTKKAVDETYSVYLGVGKNGDEYVGITKRNPNTRINEHKSSNSRRADLEYNTMPGATNLSRNDARVIEQAVINNKGLSKNGGTLVNRINSISPAKQAEALSSASSAVQSAAKAIERGDYAAAVKYLQSASDSLK